jgi:hypothetical protein
MSIFEPHGDFSLQAEGDLLVISACGAWNLETSKAYSLACKSKVKRHFAARAFYTLICTYDWLPTHDSLETLRDTTRWAIEHGMLAQAYCFSNQLEAELLSAHINSLEQDRVLRRSFTYEGAARQWLKLVAQQRGSAPMNAFKPPLTELQQ